MFSPQTYINWLKVPWLVKNSDHVWGQACRFESMKNSNKIATNFAHNSADCLASLEGVEVLSPVYYVMSMENV
jgi:hypothetical protein